MTKKTSDDILDLIDQSIEQTQPVVTKNTRRIPRRVRSRYISKTKFDKRAAAYLDQIRTGEEEMVRPATKIPGSLYADVRTVISMKRQTFQEYVLGLILESLEKLEKNGSFVSVISKDARTSTTPDEDGL